MYASRIFTDKNVAILHIIRRYSDKNPFRRTFQVIKDDMAPMFGSERKKFIVQHSDVVIIGGGILGSSVAYWLKTRAANGLSVTIIEKDLTFQNVSKNTTVAGCLHEHFSLPENILLSQFAKEFYRNIKKNLQKDVDIRYCPTGSMVLACQQYAEKLKENKTALNESGVNCVLLSPDNIKQRFPWINTDDIALGCLGSESEGVFDSWNLLQALVKKCVEMGVVYTNAKATGFDMELQRDTLMEGMSPGSLMKIQALKYVTPDNEEHQLKFAACVVAAGSESAAIAREAKIGQGDGLLSLPLPVENKEHHIFTFEDKNGLMDISTPTIMDSSGIWLRKQGLQGEILCGQIPIPTETKNREEFLEHVIRPALKNRVPSLKKAQVIESRTEVYNHNTYDESGIVGPHPYHNNLLFATGFGNLSYFHAPGIGRALAELIIDSNYTSINLTRFGFDRFLTQDAIVETNIY